MPSRSKISSLTISRPAFAAGTSVRAPSRPGCSYSVTHSAVCLNPAYALGVSVAAALQAVALRDFLAGGDRKLARRFFRAATNKSTSHGSSP
jgi:hypothetical protein